MIWNNSEDDIAQAAKAIRAGKIVAMPTETVYGLAANALDPEAVKGIFRAKGRPADNPLIVHIADYGDLERYAIPTDLSRRLADRFWPGPLTMILRKKDCIPSVVSAGLPSVAIRLPAHKTAQTLIRLSCCPLAAPSANLSGKPSGTTAQHVVHDFGDRIAGVIDGGPCQCGLESTVISLLEDRPILLRPGFVTPAELREELPDLKIANAVERELEQDEKALSPGLAHRHYAPAADTVGLLGRAEDAADYIVRSGNASSCAVMCFDGEESCFSDQADIILPYGKRGDPISQGERLFEVLRRLDESSVNRIFVNCERSEGVGLAVYNRLLRSCSFQMIKV